MPPESRYRIPSFEKNVNRIIGFIFYYRLPLITITVSFLIYFTIQVYLQSDKNDRFINASAVITGGAIVVGIFYSIINYEYVYTKGKTDEILAKRILSFKTSFEWHKPNIVKHLKTVKILYEENKHLILENKSAEFFDILESNNSARSALVSIFNFFETIAIGIDNDIMDKDLTKKSFKTLFIKYSNDYGFYINFRRRKHNTPDTWVNFTNLSEKWFNEVD